MSHSQRCVFTRQPSQSTQSQTAVLHPPDAWDLAHTRPALMPRPAHVRLALAVLVITPGHVRFSGRMARSGFGVSADLGRWMRGDRRVQIRAG